MQAWVLMSPKNKWDVAILIIAHAFNQCTPVLPQMKSIFKLNWNLLTCDLVPSNYPLRPCLVFITVITGIHH